MFKILFEKPRFLGGGGQETSEARNLLDDQSRSKYKKKEKPKPWTWRERLVVFGVFAVVLLLGIYFWVSGQENFSFEGLFESVNFDFGGFGFRETVILE